MKLMKEQSPKWYKVLFFCNNNKGDYMVKTGMTRRIDELGRLVIPKEIRKNLKIKENDQIEIMVVDNKIVLNKFENINHDRNIVILINCLKKKINHNILFTSRDKVIYSSLNSKVNDDISSLCEEIVNIIENRKDYVGYKYQNQVYNIFPLVINGDLYGSLIVYDNSVLSDNEIEIIKYNQLFLENYLE